MAEGLNGDSPFLQRTDVAVETSDELQQFADKEKAALLAYIGPYAGVRVSPVHYLTASITLYDEFAFEGIIQELQEKNVKKVYFLINSFGGVMDAAYKISRVLRSSVDEIVTFVPHIAASGGTMFAITGDKIVMGPMSNISPLDPQISYEGVQISAESGRRAFDRATRFYEKVTVQEAPYAHRAYTDRLDPFLLEEWSGVVKTAKIYVTEVLMLAKYKEQQAQEIAESLITNFPTHSYSIGPDLAKALGLRVENSEKHKDNWSLMRNWLGKYLFQGQAQSCIRYVLPQSATVQEKRILTKKTNVRRRKTTK